MDDKCLPLQQVWFNNAGVRLHAVCAGPENGRVAILLHGFPEFWYGWRKQIAPLAHSGLRVIVPDQRGYNLSDKPKQISGYALPKLEDDVLAIADQLGQDRVFLAGHDWGALVAWSLAIHHPDRVERLAIVNVPHPAVAREYLRKRPRQMLRSWYALMFQLPALPEFAMRARKFRALKDAMVRSSAPGTFTEDDLDTYRAAWMQPGALTAMVNWYRAGLWHRLPGGESRNRVSIPVRILWGCRDRFLLPEMAEDSLRLCDHGELIEFADSSHWLQHEQADRVSRLLAEWFVA